MSEEFTNGKIRWISEYYMAPYKPPLAQIEFINNRTKNELEECFRLLSDSSAAGNVNASQHVEPLRKLINGEIVSDADIISLWISITSCMNQLWINKENNE